MTKAITIRTDEATLELLENLARTTERSRNFIAGQALRDYLIRQHDAGNHFSSAPIAEDLEEYRSSFWREDDEDAFLTYLSEQRETALESNRLADLE